MIERETKPETPGQRARAERADVIYFGPVLYFLFLAWFVGMILSTLRVDVRWKGEDNRWNRVQVNPPTDNAPGQIRVDTTEEDNQP